MTYFLDHPDEMDPKDAEGHDTECTPDNLRCVKDGEPRRNWCLTCLENV